MATNTQLEAQRLVGISLTKMAQSRTQRTGISLHKSLLVATVLQKARFLCMEEVFRMVQHASPPCQNNHVGPNVNPCYVSLPEADTEDDQLVGLTPEEAGITNQTTNYMEYADVDDVDGEEDCSQSCFGSELSCDYDKENLAPETPTYFDLDNGVKDQGLRERSLSVPASASSYYKSLKRRRVTCESETEEAFLSMVPKKTKTVSYDSDSDDSVFDENSFLSGAPGDAACKAMDIDKITSLVSIFTMSSGSVVDMSEASSSNNINNNGGTYGNLARSSSTPDLCSAQAKDSGSLQQRQFIAMTV